MVILKSQNKITDFFMILAWASPFNIIYVPTSSSIVCDSPNEPRFRLKVNVFACITNPHVYVKYDLMFHIT